MMIDKGFTDYLKLMIDLHALLKRGEGESAAADDIRNRMDAPYYQQSLAQHAISEAIGIVLGVWDEKLEENYAATTVTEILRRIEHLRGLDDEVRT